MPVHGGVLPGITAGAGSSIPISAGGGTSGDVATDVRFSPVNVGGLFGSPASSAPEFLVPALILAVVIIGVAFFRRR